MGQEFKLGTEEEAMEESLLLTCFFWFAQPAFIYHLGPPAQGGTAQSRFALSTLIIHQENAYRLAYSQSDGNVFSLSSSKMNPLCVKLTKIPYQAQLSITDLLKAHFL